MNELKIICRYRFLSGYDFDDPSFKSISNLKVFRIHGSNKGLNQLRKLIILNTYF